VFSDAARTIHIQGSPVELVIPASIEGLNTVQHGNVARGSDYRELTGSVDNLCINWNLNGLPPCGGFSETFANPKGWTQVGDLVTFQNGKLVYQDGAPDGQQRRVYKSLAATLNANDNWITDIDFTPVSVGDYGGPFSGHAIVSMTAGTLEPFNDCPDVPCSNYPPSSQDAISCVYTGGYPQSDGNLYFSIHAIEGSGPSETVSPLITANALNTTYFVRLERVSATLTRLSVFSDAARSIHWPGSPVELAIPATIEGLNTVQHGNVARGSYYRALTGWVDNLCIRANNLLAVDPESVRLSDLQLFPNPAQDHITVTWENAVPQNLRLTDLLGRNIRGLEVPVTTDRLDIPLDGLQPGIYFLVWQDKTGRMFSRSFVKI
jgi:hypothetical protein